MENALPGSLPSLTVLNILGPINEIRGIDAVPCVQVELEIGCWQIPLVPDQAYVKELPRGESYVVAPIWQ